MKLCHHCGTEILLSGPVGRTQGCPKCYSDLKCCLNCDLFDPGASQQCRETQVELVGEKGKANFCEFFVFRDASTANLPSSDANRDQARKRLEALFKS